MFKFFENRLPPYPPAEPHLPPKDFMAFVWDGTRGLRGYVATMAGLSAAIAVYEALLFAVLGHVVDWLSTVAPGALWTQHKASILGITALLLGSVGLVALQTAIKHQVLAINFPLRLRWNFHRLMLGQSMAFYADEFAGRITTKIMQTALAVRDMIFTTTDVVIGMGVYLVTILVLLAGFDVRLLAPFAAWMVAYGLACWYFVPRLGKVGKAQADARSVMTGRITDAYTNIATVKLFSHTRRESEFARAAMDAFKLTGYAQMRLVSLFEIVNHILVVVMILGACGTALWLWSLGEVGAGAVAAVTAMTLRVSGHAHWVMWEMTTLFESVGTIQDGINTLTRPRTVVDAPDAQPLAVTQGEVRFDNMSFAYGNGRPVIDGLNLVIRPGEKIGLIGRSGAGKSTLVNLLLRFHDVSSGRILIDGQDIAHVTQDSLRRSIGMVTQDTSLLHRSMRDNILYGRPDASEADLHKAAERAEAADFIATLTDLQGRTGYEAHVGERGVKLSGGQRQRVAIARVMLKDAPILLLDEATSALDSEVEAAIQQSLDSLMQGKTVIAIAHRLSTIAAMDRLIVMDAGRIVEEGTHAQLLGQGGVYARLWGHQSGGFLGESEED
ncbi:MULTISPECIES: ABC transporter ATP-binding protein [unclassified Acidovorax]|uniref:ABC transporter ATP-binding protein n=1 Tax=unclassified Acidovorax TaxID=2684926 RepID=UPI001C4947C7|nr:ABC transporter ATP-binding protein/permease [Acidovorax sp. sif0732]MBV7447736.1 ABC transporter ATP-binding protein/permease [Acidovorax sp. sif0715]